MITMVLICQVSSCLTSVSHTPFDELELPSGMSPAASFWGIFDQEPGGGA
jgi:hypothetical protein